MSHYQLEFAMSFREVIERALHGRSVRQAALSMGMYQQKLQRFYAGKCLPEYDDALKIAEEAQVDPGEVLKILAAETSQRREKKEKISKPFKQLIELLNPRRDWLPA
ncbi:hypothetical protein V8921_20635 [Ralstonia mannitolilytica]|uniref:hypothetical protein n=2 Tax=Ralstonia mannitolilytica TaxID=105219 RepID=UPI003B83B8C0